MSAPIARETILHDLVQLVSDVIQDWDVEYSGGITEETRLIGDLDFQSIDVVMLVGEIHRHYNRSDLPFEKILLVDNRNVDDVRVSTIADFLFQELNAGPTTEPAETKGV